MLSNLLARLVEWSRRFAVPFVLTAFLVSGLLGWFAATHIRINTDVNQLLSADLPWRKQEVVMEKAFPQNVDVILIVVDGDTPDTAENAAAALAGQMQAKPELFTMVTRPDSIPFFRKNGLLFLPKDQVATILDQITQAQPMLAMLATDPSLRGLFNTIGIMAKGVEVGQADYARVDRPFGMIATSISATLAGKDDPLSLSTLMSDEKPMPRELRKIIVAKPVLNYGALEPGAQATDAIRAMAASMNLTPEHGVRIRLTGDVPLNDEEFASVAQGTGTATTLSVILVFVVLLLALRSFRIIVPILLALAAGLVATTAFALAAVGSFNLISVAFAVMFIGIAVDFGIQFGVRYRDQHHEEPDHAAALKRTALIIAAPLLMAAGSTALGFLAFIPTDYRGVSELGLIAGVGMIIAWIFAVTLFPALLTIARPPAEPEAVGFRWAAPIDRFMTAHRWKILAGAFLLAIGGGGVAYQVKFDFDPLDLKDPKTESVATLIDLMQDPDFNPYTIEILRPSLRTANDYADRIDDDPHVDHAMTLTSFVPDDRGEKYALIQDTKLLLGPTLDLPQGPAPEDNDIYDSARKLAASLHRIGAQHESALRLADALDEVIKRNDQALLERLHQNLIRPMYARLQAVREILDAEKLSPDSISDDLRRDWATSDGRFLVKVYPKGNARDHDTLIAFVNAVRRIAPDAGGAPVSIMESGQTVVNAFIHAGCYALVAIAILSLLVLRRPFDVVRLLAPLILAGILTLATIAAIGLPLNFANIIALPLLLSLGVSYAVYFVSYWRAGGANPLQSSMARAVLFSAATTLIAFGSLGLSSHPGTAGMGKLLTIALLYSLASTFFVLPALLGPPKTDKQ